MSIPFTGDHLRRLQTALLDAFDYGALRQMLQLELDADLDHLVPFRAATLAEMVHDLIRHYARQPGGIHQLLRAAHNARPADPQLSALYQEWIALDFALLAPAPPAAAPAIPQQRPPRAEHFLDRRQALADLLAALHPGAVVTLCGPGGIGKTALAAEAIWQLPGERFPDGLITHSFYSRSQIDLACEHIARTLGEELKPNPLAAAQRALAGRQLLLFLDGAEEADDLLALLALRGSCGVLVTTRRRSDALAVRQDVDPLPLTDAIALLQAWGGPRANDSTAAAAIAELVSRLPLALRLVGRYLAEHEENAADYLVWLAETPLAALDQGQRREQSVPLLLERSLGQVSETARAAIGVVGMLALAPLPAIAVAAALELNERAARQALGELVSYSLLARPGEDYVVSHALVHTYARERLSAPDAVVERLAHHYRGVIKAHAADFGRLDRLRSHVVALLGVCTTRSVWAPMSGLASAVHEYLDLQGYWADRLAVIEAAIAAARAQQDRYAEGAWLGNLGRVYSDLGQIGQAIKYFQQALVISREIGDRRGEGIRLGNLGNTYIALGKVEQAINYYKQVLAVSQEIGDRHSEGATLGNLGGAYYALGQATQAISHYEQALAIGRAIGDRRNEGTWLGNLGNIYANLGQVEQAVDCYQQALLISRALGDRRNEGTDLGNLGSVYADLGQVEQAIDYYQQALVIAQEISDRHNQGNWLGALGNVYCSLGQIERAIEQYGQALAIIRDIGDHRSEGAWLGALGNAYLKLEQVECAIDYYQQAIVISRASGDRRNEGVWLGALGISYVTLGQFGQAIDHYKQALVISRATSDRRSEGAWLANLGGAYKMQGELDRARELWRAALAIYEEIRSPSAERVRGWLAEGEGRGEDGREGADRIGRPEEG